jgi:hypothetical protein
MGAPGDLQVLSIELIVPHSGCPAPAHYRPQLTKSLALEYAPKGVRFLSVSPGPIMSAAQCETAAQGSTQKPGNTNIQPCDSPVSAWGF